MFDTQDERDAAASARFDAMIAEFEDMAHGWPMSYELAELELAA